MNVTVRRSVAAAALLLVVPMVSSCGFGEPTDQVYNPAVGVNDRSGAVDVLDALIVSGADGSGTVVAGLVNNNQDTADQLVNVIGARKDQSLQVTGGQADIPAGGFTQLATEGKVAAVGDRITPGNFVSLTFSFEHGENITVDVPVVAHDGDFADVPVPSGS